MERKKLFTFIAIGFVALIILTILTVGITENIWPWHGMKAYGKVFKPGPKVEPTVPPTTAPVETDDPADDTIDPNENAEKPTVNKETEPTEKNPLFDGESPTGNDVKEEVEVGGNTGDAGSSGNVEGADAVIQGGGIPGWGN